MGGRIIGCVILGRIISHRLKTTVGYRVQELHSTKGWRAAADVSADRFPWMPLAGDFCWANGCGPRRGPALEHVIPEKALLRHGWYRRKLRKEAEHAANHPDI